MKLSKAGVKDGVEFDVPQADLTAVSPYFNTVFIRYPTHRRHYVDGTSEHLQVLLKYIYTGFTIPQIFLSNTSTITVLCSTAKWVST